ncbi:ABC transporter permease [Geodermatophilus ruber]|uniref:Osmoprotectant transport system permease protein n=1 Tax=Geodermatophilus ruber TaxID=504800 RepID=A0A1I4J3I1_9ACTN|nr:ABC transporter permease [Geodermatophilus ruber]SFL60763.1 osmoprotectant transport system permease protein [Geodermatophilus ruber]
MHPGGADILDFLDFVWQRREEVLQRSLEHVGLVAAAVALSAVLGVLLGLLTYRNATARTAVIAATGTFLTIPSFALFVLLLGIVGLGTAPVVIALTMYGLLPVVRNTVTGLLQVDPAIVESAQGMGLSRRQRLLQIELPIAWPVVLTGIRVSTVVLVGIAAIGAIVNGPGLGHFIFNGLARVATPVAVDLVLTGIVGVVIVAILFDAVFTLLGKLTTSEGLR